MKILLWIQGWSGDLNSWAWTQWSKLHRRNQGTWSEGYKKWNEEKIKLKRGDILMFPSNFMYPHEVKEVTKGIRYSFVGWAF